MAISWIQIFFDMVRKAEPTLLQMLADLRGKVEPLSWDGTIIRDHLTKEDWKSLNAEMIEQLDQKNHRGLAITCASMVEDRLRWLIEMRFSNPLSEGKKDWIFTGTGPLQSFAAKVEIAYAFGLVKEEVRAELRLIGRIRNKFAHNFRRVRFTDQDIAQLCKNLKMINSTGIDEPDAMKLYGQSCLLCMFVLFTTGQLVALQFQPDASPEKSGPQPPPPPPNQG